MKSINTYIAEKFQVGKDNIRKYVYYPKDKDKLIQCIKEKIEKEGLGTEDKLLNLNDIDTSEITDMNCLFDTQYGDLTELVGYFDISDWDVSNVKDMGGMFSGSDFNGNISDWNVSNVENMEDMFWGSSFDGDISGWDVSKVTNMKNMFRYSEFTGKNGGISNWNVSRVRNMYRMFYGAKFNGNINKWDVSNVENMKNMNYMFYDCPLQKNPPKWYKNESN